MRVPAVAQAEVASVHLLVMVDAPFDPPSWWRWTEWTFLVFMVGRFNAARIACYRDDDKFKHWYTGELWIYVAYGEDDMPLTHPRYYR